MVDAQWTVRDHSGNRRGSNGHAWRSGITRGAAVLSVILSMAMTASAETFPNFDERYWQEEQAMATGKIWRGAGLAVLGVASAAPTSLYLRKAMDDPDRYLAYCVVAAIGTLGMTLHGFLSVGFGGEQRDTARMFLKRTADDSPNMDHSNERAYYLYSRRKTAVKLSLFGGALLAQSVVLLANGVAFNARHARGDDLGDIKIWPSYLIGSLLLGSGLVMLAKSVLRLKTLRRLADRDEAHDAAVSLSPYFLVSDENGGYNLGLVGQVTF